MNTIKEIYKTKFNINKKDNTEKKINLYLLKYKIKYGDKKYINAIKAILLILIIISISLFIYFFKPFDKLKLAYINNLNNYNKKYDIYIVQKSEYEKKDFNRDFVPPISGNITSKYGMRKDPISGKYTKHTGIDISGKHRDNVLASASGTVVFAGNAGSYGNAIEIVHNINGKTYYTYYAHLSRIKVKVNDYVEQGQVIGIEGGAKTDPNPGYSTGHHLHFEIRKSKEYGSDINPYSYIF